MKYQARDGWTNRDLLRLAHPKAATPEHDAIYKWVVRGEAPANALVQAFERARRAADVHEIARLVREHDLPRECVPTEWLSDARVWAALLERMPMTAMIRNLATMTRVGLVASMSAATRTVIERLSDGKKLAVSLSKKGTEAGDVHGVSTWNHLGCV